MGVAIGEPQTMMSGGASDHRAGIRKAWPAAHPGRGLHPLPEREQALGRREQAFKLHGRRRRIACGELDPCCKTDSLLHRRQAVTVLCVHHRPGKSRVAVWAEVAVIASLDTEREPDAEGPEHIGCEWSQRNHCFLRVHWALRGIDAPLRVSAV